MEINELEIQKWTRALRSGEYKQGKKTLQSKHGYCCLGVACEVLKTQPLLVDKDTGYMLGGSPDFQESVIPRWLVEINSDFFYKMKKDLDFVTLNDLRECTFDEIADLIEAVYILKVLE